MSAHDPIPLACAAARRAIHRELDGGAPAAEPTGDPARHLATCAACREVRRDLLRLQAGLRALPRPGLPADVRRAVLAATVGADAGRRRRRLDWRPLAAAAALGAILIGLAGLVEHAPPRHAPAEVQAAEQQARLVLKLTATALRRTERAALDDVLAGEVSPALERVPIDWPAARRGRHDG